MAIYAIGDLHLPGNHDKPMNVFGIQWDNHFETIQNNWRECVREDDVVLIPGDISWAMRLEDAVSDLESIAELPGEKILIRGNHDYWWSSIGKVREVLPSRMHALQNDAIAIGDTVFCGTRGWTFPTEFSPLEAQELKIFNREVARLEMSLNDAVKKAGDKPVIALMHFPPLLVDGLETAFSQTLENAGVADVVYGHLHGIGIKNGFSGTRRGVRYHLVSCDSIEFAPVRIK